MNLLSFHPAAANWGGRRLVSAYKETFRGVERCLMTSGGKEIQTGPQSCVLMSSQWKSLPIISSKLSPF